MRKSLVIFLFLLLILQSGGLFIALKVQQYGAKALMLHQMNNPETNYERLTLSRNDYSKSLVEKNEIFYKGNMYDIKNMTFDGDSVNMNVIHDKAEGKVFKKLKKLLSHDKTSHKKVPDTILRLLSLNYLRSSGSNDAVILNSKRFIVPCLLTIPLLRIGDVLSPPPELT